MLTGLVSVNVAILPALKGYRMTQQTENHAKLEAVAAALGGRLEAQDTCDGQRGIIVLSTGERFGVATGGYGTKDRIEVYAAYPRHVHAYGNEATTHLVATVHRDFMPYDAMELKNITMKVDQSPEAIAKLIERRYLSRYRERYAKAVEFCERRAAYYENKRTTMQAIDKAFKSLRYRGGDEVSVGGESYQELAADVRIYNLKPDQAEKLAAFLKTL